MNNHPVPAPTRLSASQFPGSGVSIPVPINPLVPPPQAVFVPTLPESQPVTPLTHWNKVPTLVTLNARPKAPKARFLSAGFAGVPAKLESSNTTNISLNSLQTHSGY